MCTHRPASLIHVGSYNPYTPVVWYDYCLCFEPGETEAHMSLKVKVIIDGEDVLKDKNAFFLTKSF